jgi:hypothetical protein
MQVLVLKYIVKVLQERQVDEVPEQFPQGLLQG